jgi:N-acetylglucosaminyl-diphospho-decaprenol L-rhamnosyltransferase
MHRLLSVRPGYRAGSCAREVSTSTDNSRSLDVVITSYRAKEYLRRCLVSLRENAPATPVRVRVIDNASGDGLAEMVQTEFSEVDFTANPENRGFASATNAGIEAGHAEFVLALNPDTQLFPGALDHLMEVMEEHPDVGICGPLLVRPTGGVDHAASRSFPTPLNSIGHFVNLSRVPGAPKALRGYVAPMDRSGPVDAVNGAFMLIRRKALEDVGLFDEGYWMYMEDLDLCYRMRQAGWLTWFEPTVESEHVKGGSTGRYRSLRLNYAFHYGMYRFYRKHYAESHSVFVNAAVYAGVLFKLTVSSIRSLIGRTVLAVRRAGGRLLSGAGLRKA